MSNYKIGERYKNIQVEFLNYSANSFNVRDNNCNVLNFPYSKSIPKPKELNNSDKPFEFAFVSFTITNFYEMRKNVSVFYGIYNNIIIKVKRPHWSLFYYLKKD